MKHDFTIYAETPAGFSERNDCSVRALRVAADLSYAEAHRVMEQAGRKPREGVLDSVMAGVLARYRFQRVYLDERLTVNQFSKKYRQGIFVLRVRSHFLAVRAGVVHDWKRAKKGSRIFRVWQRQTVAAAMPISQPLYY